MRKVICIVTALLLCVSLASTVFATSVGNSFSTDFSPSISAKGAPVSDSWVLRVPGEEDQTVTSCVVVSSVNQALNKSTDITQEERDLLLEVYEKIADGTMELPLKKGFAIRDLVDVSFKYEACRSLADHNDKAANLEKEGVVLSGVFKLGVSKDTDVAVLTYIDGEWEEIEEVVNNGDGSVTCTFEDICPVAFAVRNVQDASNPDTGDAAGANMGLWIGMMAVCAVALVGLVVVRAKKSK